DRGQGVRHGEGHLVRNAHRPGHGRQLRTHAGAMNIMNTQDTHDQNVDRAGRLDTATLSDALDKLGIAGQCYRIKPRDNAFRMAGRAWTLLYGPAANPPGTVGDYIDDVPPGSVIVLDNGGGAKHTR